MDSYGFTDNIKVEKANALARYRRFNNISKMLRAIEVFVAVALISWSSTRLPAVFKVSGEYLYACSSYVLNQHVVFFVGNVIVVVCYVLSGYSKLETESDEPEIVEDNRYRSRSNNDIKSDSDSNPAPVPVEVQVLPDVKHTSVDEVPDSVVDDDLTVKTETDAETAIKQAVKQIERFHRTQSAKLSMEISTRPRRELRRSVTERQRSVAETAGDGDLKTVAVETVEMMSNEEFRLAVEAFIFKQQSFLKQQSM